MVVENGTMMTWQTYAEGYHHKCNLRDCREGKHTLDVALCTSYSGSVEGGESTNNHYYLKSLGSVLNPYGEQTCNLEHTGNNHGSSMDKCRYRSRTLHSIWQPDVQREHSRLTSTTDEHQHKSCRQNHTASSKSASIIGNGEGRSASAVSYLSTGEREVIASSVVTEDENTDKEEHIGKTGHDKSLLRSMYGSLQSVVEANEEVRANAHKLPEHIHLEDVGGEHQSEH